MPLAFVGAIILHTGMTNSIHIFASERAIADGADINMYILSHDAQLAVGAPYEVDVVMTNLGRTLLNASETEIRFDPEKIRVDDVSIHQDLCKEELVVERIIDNNEGRVQLSCLTFDPFEGPATVIATLTITPVGYGSTSLYFGEQSNVYVHDGHGTKINGTLYGKDYEVAQVS